ncbi:MAG: nucleotidyltransferase family protein [Candidatus Omnitrophica bacterium]|nr:nucleotidyltransferase family protein [Candidatus Omnitrophota bacterium]MBI3083207.1 nucleotidyltransferase family protein [Candidatus Omnitrophota bacterium]
MAVSAVLLAAGYATRLYPLTNDQPKALLPLGQGVLLDETLSSLRSVGGLRQCLLVTNHRFASQFRQWQRARGADVRILDDGTEAAEARLGALRDLQLASREADIGDDLLVVGTDNLFRWPLAEFVAQAQRYRPHPSIALWEAPSKEAATQFGVVTRDANARITAFVEKSPHPPAAEVALCVYYFPAPMRGRIQAFLDEGGTADAPGYFIQWLVQRSEVYGIMMPGPWYDIGTLEAYETVVREWH